MQKPIPVIGVPIVNGVKWVKKLIKSIEKMDELELINQILEYKKVESKINSVKENLLN